MAQFNGTSGSDFLFGTSGADTLAGGAGNDSYYVNNAGDVVVENANGGNDLVYSSVAYTLAANVEALTLIGTAASNGTGNNLNNIITGNSAANRLDGSTGADTMSGGAGDDLYIVDNAGDVVTENANEGTDTVQSAVSYTLGANVENLTLTGTNVISGTGNGLANVIVGNAVGNVLNGAGGNDTLTGGSGNDTIDGGSGFDTAVYSGAGSDYRITFSGATFTLTDLRAAPNDGIDTLAGIEAIRFSDYTAYLDGRNNAPYALADAVATKQNTPLVISAATLLANDVDPEGSTLRLVSVTNGAHGTAVLNANGTVTYVPTAGYSGADSFNYTVSDGSLTATAKVNVTVTAPSAPVAGNDAVTGIEDHPLVTGNVLANDSDADSTLTAASITGYTQGTHGAVAYNNNGTFTYTPTVNFSGADSFTYTVSDGTRTSTATVSVTVNAVNDAPVAAGDAATGNEDALITTGNVLANDVDVDNTLTAASVTGHTQGAHGAVVYNGDGAFTYAPTANFNGTDSFTYTITDGALTSTATVNVTVNAVNDAPVAAGDAVSGDEDTALTTGNVLANDSDIDSALSVGIYTAAANGSVVYNNDGTFTYTPNLDFNGADSFTYTATDGAQTSMATVHVTVNAVNDAPVARADTNAGDAVIEGASTAREVNLADVAGGIGGFKILGEAAGDITGLSVAAAGDVNGDGRADILIGARYNDAQAWLPNSGATYVVYGKADGATVDLHDVASGIGGFKISGEESSDMAGVIAGIGDVNHDGYADVLVGARGNGEGSEGAAYVVYGKADSAPVDLQEVAAGIGGWKIVGTEWSDNAGASVSALGDVNGDGAGDFLIGADAHYVQDVGNVGGGYVVFGKPTGLPMLLMDGTMRVVSDTTPVLLSDIANGIGGYAIVGESHGSQTGYATAGVGDVNHDGVADMMIGGYKAATATGVDTGAAYVLFGKGDGTSVELADISAGNGGGFAIRGEHAGDMLGISLAGVGDLNGDGYADVLVGAPGEASKGALTGAAYVVYGKADSAAVDLDDVAAGVGGFKIFGERASSYTGLGVARLDDMNGDGLAEFLIGAPITGGSGAAYVVYGKADSAAVYLDDVAAGIGGFKLIGEAPANYPGYTVSSLGDLNGDGRADLLLGAPLAPERGSQTGGAYVVFAPGSAADTTASGNVLANDSDAEGSFALVGVGVGAAPDAVSGGVGSALAGVYGTLTLRADGSYDYVLDSNVADTQRLGQGDTGSDVFSYTIADAEGATSTTTLTISVTGTNDVPVAGRDNAAGDEDTTIVTANVLANDSDADGVVSLTGYTQAAHGSVGYNGDGTFTYTPDENYNGTDGFTYTISDGTASATGSVAVTVYSVNDAAVVTGPAHGELTEDRVYVTSGDLSATDVDGSDEAFQAVDTWTASANGYGSYTVSPWGAWAFALSNGNAAVQALGASDTLDDSFTVYTQDGTAQTVTITIHGTDENLAPVAVDDTVSGNEDTIFVTGNVLANDTDASPLTISGWTHATHGNVYYNGGGVFRFEPYAGNYNGPDSFTYTVTDGALTSTATVRITVNPVNDAPIGNADTNAGNGALYDPVLEATHGIPAGFRAINLDDVTAGRAGFKIIGEAGTQQVGLTVSTIGDVNHDGLADLRVSGRTLDDQGRPADAIYTVYGKHDGAPVYLSDVAEGHGGVKSVDHLLTALGPWAAGDVNGDFLPDLIVGVENDETAGPDTGAAYVLFGKPDDTNYSIGDVDAGIGGYKIVGQAQSDLTGHSVRGIGDVNGDGLDDLLIGAPGSDVGSPDSGAAYVLYGKSDTGTVDLNLLERFPQPLGGFMVYGESPWDLAGTSVAGGRDVNGDGRPDIVIGAPGDEQGGAGTGAAFVVCGPSADRAGDPTATGNVLTNDFDVEGDSFALVGITSGASSVPVTGGLGSTIAGTYGSLVLNADGNWVYTLDDANPQTDALGEFQRGYDVFSYTLRDSGGAESTTELTVQILGRADGVALDGTAGDDVLVGTTVGDRLSGGDGNDVLSGGLDADTLTGGAGADRFTWASWQETGNDLITDFTPGEGGDVLDLSEVLQGYVDGVSNPASFIRLSEADGATDVQVSLVGNGIYSQTYATLQGVTDLTLGDLLDHGNLLV